MSTDRLSLQRQENKIIFNTTDVGCNKSLHPIYPHGKFYCSYKGRVINARECGPCDLRCWG